MIEVQVNDKKHSISNNENLISLLEKLEVSTAGIAVAINDEIITKNNWKETRLNNKDRVLVIKATQGG